MVCLSILIIIETHKMRKLSFKRFPVRNWRNQNSKRGTFATELYSLPWKHIGIKTRQQEGILLQAKELNTDNSLPGRHPQSFQCTPSTAMSSSAIRWLISQNGLEYLNFSISPIWLSSTVMTEMDISGQYKNSWHFYHISFWSPLNAFLCYLIFPLRSPGSFTLSPFILHVMTFSISQGSLRRHFLPQRILALHLENKQYLSLLNFPIISLDFYQGWW